MGLPTAQINLYLYMLHTLAYLVPLPDTDLYFFYQRWWPRGLCQSRRALPEAAECGMYDGEHYTLPVIGLWTFAHTSRHSFRWPNPWLFSQNPVGHGSISQIFRTKLLAQLQKVPWDARERRVSL